MITLPTGKYCVVERWLLMKKEIGKLRKSSIFAARKMNRFLRHIASIVLLTSYLPMVVLSSIHVHHETIDVHDDGMQCVGHIEEAHHHDHDCLFCNFLAQSYLVEDAGQTATILPAAERISMPTQAMAKQFHHGVTQLRAPPISVIE